MTEINEKRKVLFGNDEYIYSIDKNGEETLTRMDKLDNKDIKVILKGSNDGCSKDIEKFVTEVLSDLYIQRNIEKLT